MNTYDVIVIGAGPGGLAAAAALSQAGLRPVTLERSDRVGARWHSYYDRLTLQSPSWLTSLPGLRIPRAAGRWPSRDGFIAYLERYAEHHELDIRLNREVWRIDRTGDTWTVSTPAGGMQAHSLVIATGYNNVPHIPAWPGREEFTGELIHAASYRNALPYRDRDVLVVGAGNSGAEIAYLCSDEGAARVRLAVRTPPHVAPREFLGMPGLLAAVLVRRLPSRIGDLLLGGTARLAVGDLSRYGLQRPKAGMYTKYLRDYVTPILDTGIVGAIRRGDVEIVGAVERFEGPKVVLADGQRISPEVVIAATGYQRGLEPLVGRFGVLRRNGMPAVHGARTHPAAPGMHFIGYTHPFSGNIREIAIDARKIARAVARRHAEQAAPAPAFELYPGLEASMLLSTVHHR